MLGGGTSEDEHQRIQCQCRCLMQMVCTDRANRPRSDDGLYNIVTSNATRMVEKQPLQA